MSETSTPALKEWFNEARYRQFARDLASVHPGFDSRQFLALTLPGLEPLNLLQRLRRATEAMRATLPPKYPAALTVLRKFAPLIDHNFVAIVLSDFVGCYGLDDVDRSLEALKFFTRFGSSEFAIREFLRRDLKGTLRVMEQWSRDDDEHVRRLASEGCRPRLPWSFQLTELIADPSPVAQILESLKADPSLYVRKSVANHLNDITKDHPGWVLDRIAAWDLAHAHTAWIVKRALRTLIKKGDRRALGVIGAGARAEVAVEKFLVAPQRIRLGEAVTFTLALRSTARVPQQLVIDYAVHYVKQSGAASAKVFKWKEIRLEPRAQLQLARRQTIRDFTTRRHHPGRHAVELLINGERCGTAAFSLDA